MLYPYYVLLWGTFGCKIRTPSWVLLLRSLFSLATMYMMGRLTLVWPLRSHVLASMTLRLVKRAILYDILECLYKRVGS